jgi:hypothetical protein
MSANPLPQVDDVVYTVTQWKDELDPRAPWWQKAFYRFIYLPFQEFSLKAVKIPRPTETIIEGGKISFRIWEIQGHFASEHEADIACLTDRYCYKDYPFGRPYAPESGQIGKGPVFPRAKNPNKRIRPVLEMAIIPRRKITKLEGEVARLHQVLDR